MRTPVRRMLLASALSATGGLALAACCLLPLPQNAPYDESFCDQVPGRSIKRHVFDIREFEDVACVAGNVSVHVYSSLVLPKLIAVGGHLSLEVQGSAPVEIDLPALESVGHDLSLETNFPLHVRAPLLRSRVLYGCATADVVVDAPLARVDPKPSPTACR